MHQQYLSLLKSALSLCPMADDPVLEVVKKPAIKIKKPKVTTTKVTKKPVAAVKQVTVTKVEKPKKTEKKAYGNPGVGSPVAQPRSAVDYGKGAYRAVPKAMKAIKPTRPANPATPTKPGVPMKPAKPAIPKPTVPKGSPVDEALSVTSSEKRSAYRAVKWANALLRGDLGR